MSATSDVDVATLHTDCNISHTISQSKVKLSPDALENLLQKTCLCTLEDIVFQLDLEIIDIRHERKESQLLFLTRLASERFNSTCFTDPNNTICIKCSLSPDLEVCISNWNVEQLKESASRFLDEANHIPVDVKLHIACIAKDHQRVKDLLKEADVDKKNVLFYGISCGEIVDFMVNTIGINVNIKDARGRTPLFYALTSSLDSAKKLLDKGASVTKTDHRQVSVLTFLADNMLKSNLPAEVKSERIKLLSEKELPRADIVKDVINLVLCKFIQVLGSTQPAQNTQDNHLTPKMLCELLEMILSHTSDSTHADDRLRNSLISQFQTIQEHITPNQFAVCNVLQCFDALHANPSAPDSEGNTCLHYATQLLFFGVPEETVISLCDQLMHMKSDAKMDAKNHKRETPLLFCLSSKHLIASAEVKGWSGNLRKVCEILLENGSELRHKNHKGESAFHLILKICQYAILLEDDHEQLKRRIFEEMLEILLKFAATEQAKSAVRKRDVRDVRDVHLNSPLHLLATLALKPSGLYSENVCNGYSFESLLRKILTLLLKCGVLVDEGNEKRQTPLHMCRTWTAVKLLFGAGAEPDVKDLSGCTPLLAAAKRNTCIKEDSDLFYPDVTQAPNEFWKEVLDKKLDPWTSDKNGNSVLSILIQKRANHLTKALIETACDQEAQIDTIGVPLLTAVCKDQCSENYSKLDLVKLLVTGSRIRLVNKRPSDSKDTALHFSCRNILELPDSSVESSVHWEIVKYLLLCGADVNAAGEEGESCLALTGRCPLLEYLLSTPVEHSTLPLVLTNWEQSSECHYQKLSMVARMVSCQNVGSVYFCQDAFDESMGSVSFVFAGIVQGGREVAVKRIDKSRTLHTNSLENVLVPSARCEQIVQYLLRVQDENFYYLAFELMEGDLDHHLDNVTGAQDATKLCKDLLMGLRFLQSQGVVHGNINPRTVFYQNNPSLCLKLGNCKARSSRRSWVAPEVLKEEISYSKESDMFSCGLVLHYLLSGKKHPFAPADAATKNREEVLIETDHNIRNGNIVKIDDPLSPEATHLVQVMLDSDPSIRPSADDALVHPFFWDNETKKRFLHVVGNEPEIAMQVKRHPLTAFESEVEGRFRVIVTGGTSWNDSPPYDNMSATYNGMKKKRDYDYETVSGLIRFIRNAYEHINEQPETIQKIWKDDFVLDDYFPHLVIEVYKALTTSRFHQLHKSRKEIKKFLTGLK